MTQTSTTPQERIRGMGLLFVCLMTLGMGHSLFFAISRLWRAIWV